MSKKLSDIKEEVFKPSDLGLSIISEETLMDKVSWFFASRLCLRKCPFCGGNHPMVYARRITRSDGAVLYTVDAGCDPVYCKARTGCTTADYKTAFINAIGRWQRRYPEKANEHHAFAESLWNHIQDPSTPLMLKEVKL